MRIIVELFELVEACELDPLWPRASSPVDRLVSRRNFDEYLRQEQQRLAANQVSIGNSITSMRLISALDWALFFERVSLVEQILRQDPAGVYPQMDFATRDRYRHKIERMAKLATTTKRTWPRPR